MRSHRLLPLLPAFLLAACIPPPPEVRSVDLSAIRIGAERAAIERQLGLPEGPPSASAKGRTAAVYRYGPRVGPGQAFVCRPYTLGMQVSCAIMNARIRTLASAAAEEEARRLGEGMLEVIYGAEGRAEWVVFAGDPSRLASTDALIARAECGDPAAQAAVGRGFATGAEGLPLDPEQAYRWTALAARSGGPDEAAARDRYSTRLPAGSREAIDRAVAAWQPLRPCG